MNIHVEVDGGDGKVRLTAYDGGTGAKLYKWGIQQAPFDASAIVPSSGALIFDVSNDFNPVDSKSVTITYTFQTTS
jgi:hypothetical protein